MTLPWSGQRQRMMNSTPAEFRRALQQAFGTAVSGDDAVLRVRTPDAVLCFQMTVLPGQNLGLLHIAALRLEIVVECGEAEAVDRLLAQVDRATLRGGG